MYIPVVLSRCLTWVVLYTWRTSLPLNSVSFDSWQCSKKSTMNVTWPTGRPAIPHGHPHSELHISTLNRNKCTKHQFIHLLMATLKNSHIENSKNRKRWCCPHHTDCVSMCLFSMCEFSNVAVTSVKTDVLYIYICCFMTKILCAVGWADTASALDKCNLSTPW